MICLLALPVLALLGIFSAAYRELAKEAWKCLTHKLTLRPCQTGLDTKLKTTIIASMRRTPRVADVVYRYFEVFTWILVVLTIASFAGSAYGFYNYYIYGNCNGPGAEGFCVFDPTGANKFSGDEESCRDPGLLKPENLVAPNISMIGSYPSIGNPDANLTVIEFGCFTCKYTQKAAPIARELQTEFGDRVRFIIIPVPLGQHNFSSEATEAGYCVASQSMDAFWNFHDQMFATELPLFGPDVPREIALRTSPDPDAAATCIDTDAMNATIEAAHNLFIDARIYGTPTFFIGEERFVGPKTYRELSRAIKRSLP